MKIIKSLVFGLGLFLVLNLIITIFSYFNIFKENMTSIFKIIAFIITFIISGIYLGLNIRKKSLINGTKLSLLFILFSIVLILILPGLEFSVKTILYYIFIFLLINLGSFIGVNKKKVN
ncbi:MAG: TIGR04086 family membrane protein [Bacilli bacterium]|nr:TIGR04086 family membrane protein [Bacilli bacterium]